MSDKTYTEPELKAAVDKAVAEATASLSTKIAELEGNEHQAALAKAVEEAKAEMQAKVEELQAKLDTTTVELTAEREKRETMEAEKVAAEEAAAKQAEMDARRDDRKAKVEEAGVFTEEYIAENLDRFVAMADEDFEKSLKDWKSIAAKADEVPGDSALAGARETASAKPPAGGVSAVREVFDLRRQGIDPRTVRV